MFSSKPLSERNNDPTPHKNPQGGLKSRQSWSDHWSTFDPRPKFQYGKLPANPVLVAFRAGDYKAGDLTVNIFDVELGRVTREQDRHAARVLTLLATLTPKED